MNRILLGAAFAGLLAGCAAPAQQSAPTVTAAATTPKCMKLVAGTDSRIKEKVPCDSVPANSMDANAMAAAMRQTNQSGGTGH
jgi:uncharacterized protein involved in copper resistance